MGPTQLSQLAELLLHVNAINGGEDSLYIGEAIIYNASDEPIAKIEYNEAGALVLTEVLRPRS